MLLFVSALTNDLRLACNMVRCKLTDDCPFFTDVVGYSPELNDAMKQRYCLVDNPECARRRAIDSVGRENVPVEMLPSDLDLLEQLQ